MSLQPHVLGDSTTAEGLYCLMIIRASCAMRTIWAAVAFQNCGLFISFQASKYWIWFPVCCINAVTKALNWTFVPDPSRFSPMGALQEPKPSEHASSHGSEAANAGTPPNVYSTV